MARRADPRRDRWLLGAWLAAAFAASAVRAPAVLAGAWLVAMALLWRGLPRALGRTLRSVVPVTVGLAVASALWLRLLQGGWPPLAPFAALALRAGLIGFLGFSVLARVDLLRALQPWPVPARLLTVTLAQIHALRLLATASRDGLRSRLPRRPGALDVVRNAGGLTATLVALAARNARDISDAMRARGF